MRYIVIDQANAATESNGRFFNKTNRFESICGKRIDLNRESEFSSIYRSVAPHHYTLGMMGYEKYPVRVLPSRMVWKNWLLDGEKSLRICITVLTEYRRVIDRQTDGHLATA